MGSAIDLVLAGGNSAKISRPSEMQRLSTEFWRKCLKEKKSSSTGSSKKNNCLGEAGQMAQSTNTSNAISYACRGDGFGIRTRADGRTTRPNGRILELMAE